MRTEQWCGFNIRFVEVDGEWYAILKDICDALKLRTFHISQRLDPDLTIKVPVEIRTIRPKKYKENSNIVSNDTLKYEECITTKQMIALSEVGIYEALYASRKLEARQFRRWSAEVMVKLRKNTGLEGFEAMKMTEKKTQKQIDNMFDIYYFDEETNMMMRSVTTEHGDVIQIPVE